MATTIKSAASELLQQQINNTPKTALGKPTTVSRATNIPGVGLATAPKPLGRPPGQLARIDEFKAKLFGENGDLIISKLIQTALNDNAPGQMAALKMCVDRVLPLSHFEKATVGGGSAPMISINITGLTGSTVTTGDIGGSFDNDVIDVEPRESTAQNE